jgi:hypothetical protein
VTQELGPEDFGLAVADHDAEGLVLREQRGALLRLGAWSSLEALPVLVSGQLVALAVDRGFLAGHLEFGLVALAAYGLALMVGAWGVRQVTAPLASVVETVRDATSLYAVWCPPPSGAQTRTGRGWTPPRSPVSPARRKPHAASSPPC